MSGDYYDFVPVDDTWTAIALGDVSGKGIAAALVMATLQAAVHAQLRFAATRSAAADAAPSTAGLTETLSRQRYDCTPAEKYATLFCSFYDDRTGHLVYTNAGHLPPILLHGGQPRPLDVSGTVVGLLPLFSYTEQRVLLQDGDLVAIFSDGVTEAENAAGEQFGTVNLERLLAAHSKVPLNELVQIVLDRVTPRPQSFTRAR